MKRGDLLEDNGLSQRVCPINTFEIFFLFFFKGSNVYVLQISIRIKR